MVSLYQLLGDYLRGGHRRDVIVKDLAVTNYCALVGQVLVQPLLRHDLPVGGELPAVLEAAPPLSDPRRFVLLGPTPVGEDRLLEALIEVRGVHDGGLQRALFI